MSRLSLKGGNALKIAHKIGSRASFDLDFSMSGDFTEEELEQVRIRLEKRIQKNFNEYGYYIFDFKLEEKPNNLSEDLAEFWGGYKINFKIIDEEKYEILKDDQANLRRNALSVGKKGSTKLLI